MNPCPQGYDCDLAQGCRCTPEQQRRHRARISAPLLDRIDLQIHVPKLPAEALRGEDPTAECSADVRTRVVRCRESQLERQGVANAELGGKALERHCALGDAEAKLLEQAMRRFGYSARAYHRIIRVARTIADLAGSERIEAPHLGEALGYRAMDRWRARD
jgi:magnesium chelatase family protein